MSSNEFVKTITKEESIHRYLRGMADQQVAISIGTRDKENPRTFSTHIARLDDKAQKIIIHQPTPSDWKSHIKPSEDVDISCRTDNGTINFESTLKPLDEEASSMYCHLNMPSEMSRRQQRTSFRVSAVQFQSQVTLHMGCGEETRIEVGDCKDISQGGAMVFIPRCSDNIAQGDQLSKVDINIVDIDAVDIRINNLLQISVPAKVCHTAKTGKHGMRLGLNFIDPDPAQLNALRAAIIQMERLNIHRETA